MAAYRLDLLLDQSLFVGVSRLITQAPQRLQSFESDAVLGRVHHTQKQRDGPITAYPTTETRRALGDPA